MPQLFISVINGSLAAGWVVLGVLVLRLLLRKAPKWVLCCLWAIVALRLIVPVSFQSSFSLLPSTQTIPTNIVTTQTPAIESGFPTLDSAVNPLFTLTPKTGLLETLLSYAGQIWLAGVVGMLMLFLISWLRLKYRVRISLRLRNNVYICDGIDAPFVFGLFPSRIYLPSFLDEEQMSYVLAHEQAHIRRKDHWWKPLGFLLLSIHWFNPLLWLSYILLCRDIEQACDSKVIASMGTAQRQGYSETLLACSQHRHLISACPIAFGEVGVKARIRSILNYRKPAFWILAASCLAITVAVGCLLTDPVACRHSYEASILRASSCTHAGVEKLTCTQCAHSYTQPAALAEHTYDQGAVTLAATCTETGILTYHCTACGHTKEQTIACTEHTLGASFCSLAATCVSEGQSSATCTQCHQTFITGTIPVCDDHDLTETVTPSTCAVQGQILQKCTRCSYSKTVLLPLEEHNYVFDILVLPHCLYQGREEYVCSQCGSKKTEYLGYREHFYMSNGSSGYCVECGASYPKSKPKNKNTSVTQIP